MITINAKELRASLPKLVERVRKGASYAVIYRSRPAFKIVPFDQPSGSGGDVHEDSLYRAAAVGRSKDGERAADHDAILYGS